MSPIAVLTILILMFVGYGSWSCYDKTKKVRCQYDRQDKTVEFRYVKVIDGETIFDGNRCRILPEFFSSYIEKSGIHMFFPTKVNFIRFNWASVYPVATVNQEEASDLEKSLTESKETIASLREKFEEMKRVYEENTAENVEDIIETGEDIE